MKTKLLLLLFLASFSNYAQNTKIPDLNFEKFLINEKYDSGIPDGQVLTANISAIKTLNVSGLNISDLTGIQDFKALTQLICSFNNLTSLDVSQNTALLTLNCFSNKITSLNISTNTLLDNLNCASNLLTVLDISAIRNVRILNCYDNKLKVLDLKNNTNLSSLNCSANDFTNGLTLFKNTYLTFLNCNFSNLTSLDLSENKSLQSLNCQGNSLKALDLSKNTALTFVDCSSNQLKSLDLKNGKNTILTTTSTFKNNPNLSCIQVDNDITATANWGNLKDAAATYSTNCSIEIPYTSIPDINFENKLIALGFDSGAPDGRVPTANINKITFLNVSSSSIADLTGIQDFVSLTVLWASQNKLTKLDVSKNLFLESLSCESNKTLETLNVSKNLSLTQLWCYGNKITNLDVTKLPKLATLYCDSNPLTSIDLSGNPKLGNLRISDTDITSLDLSKNPALTYIYGRNNRQLSQINLKNGNNKILPENALIIYDNSILTCILVDDVDYANANWAKSKDASVDYSLVCTEPEYTLIPDIEFEKKLVNNGVDFALDGRALTRKLAAREYLYLDDAPITDLTGLEAFTNLKSINCSKIKVSNFNFSKNTKLTTINCYSNNITSIDLSQNLALTDVNLSNNSLTEINVSKNTALKNLNVYQNKITAIDVSNNKNLISLSISNNTLGKIDVSGNPQLTYLGCTDNSLTTLDVTHNPLLKGLDFERNKITDIDVTKNPELESLNTSQNPLKALNVTKNTKLIGLQCYGSSYVSNGGGGSGSIKSLDLSNNTLLNTLNCGANQLTSLDLTSNIQLQYFRGYGNAFTDLDLTKNTNLLELHVGDNKLKTVNLKNGNNTKLTKVNFQGNKNLSCIQVENVEYSNTNWATNKDATATFNVDCAYSTLIPDEKFEQKLIDLGIDTDGKNGKVLTANISTLTSLDVSSAEITDLTGIEDFRSLESLSADQNKLTKINVSKNQKLVSLNVSKNEITKLDVKNNIKLESIYCNNNLLATLDLSKNVYLKTIYCSDNKLISLNLKNGNNVASDPVGLKNFTNNPNLKCIQVDDETYASTKWTNFKDATASYSSNCEYSTAIPDPKFEDKLIALGIDSGEKDGKVATANITEITSLDVSSSQITDLTGIQDFASLKSLNVKSNTLKTLDVSKNTELTSLDCSFNALTSLSISENKSLRSLTCYYNSLTSLDISNNIVLYNLDCSGNKIESLELSKNKELIYLNVNNNQIKNLDISKNPLVSSVLCYNNKLQTLNLQNGANKLLTSNNVSFSGNLSLYCILVDDVAYANSTWSTKKDAIATFNTECTGEINLPANNFAIETKGESCLGENNGEISIVGKASFAYSATINDKSYTFTNNALKITALTPGTYNIKITIPEMIYEQIFNVTIQKGATATGKSSISAKNVEVEITEGTAPFTVFVNGTEQFQTTDTNFTVSMQTAGLVEVATAKACEGVFAKKVSSYELGTILAAYPNPTTGIIEIEIPSTKTEIAIELYNFGGQLVSHGTYNIESGKALLNLEKLPSGIYAAKVNLETPEYIKIIKK
jgi:Leucine-rich repeat (LRR) protein